MFISVVNTKGGVGKTTLAVHTAAWLHEQGLRVAVIDADEQRSSSEWLAKAALPLPVHAFNTAREILHGAPQLRREYDAVVADAPAALSAKIAILASLAELAVMPLQPSMLDIWASYRTARVLYKLRFHGRRAGYPRAITVLNRARTRTRLARIAAVAIRQYGFPVAPVVLEARTAYAEACEQHTFVWRLGRRAALAAAEINRLCEFMLQQIPECPAAALVLARRKALALTRQVVAQDAKDARSVSGTPTPPALPAAAPPSVNTPAAGSVAPPTTG